jgi:zinc protease
MPRPDPAIRAQPASARATRLIEARFAGAFLAALLILTFPNLAPAQSPPPPADPQALTTLTLDNALQLWVHPTPPNAQPNAAPGDIGLWLVIHSGVLAEADDQIGAAYLAKRAAGLGTPSVPLATLDTLRPRFGRPSSRATPSAGAHALLSHDAVVYTLVVPADDPAAWNHALAHYADLLANWSPDDAAIARAHELAAERTDKLSPDELARRHFLPDLFADQPLAARDLIPAPDRLAQTSPDNVRAFVRGHYRPSNATLIIAGPIDPSDAISRVRRALVSLPNAGPPPARSVGIDHGVGGRVSALAVQGYDPAEVSLLTLSAPESHDPSRRAVLDAVAAELVGARVRAAAPLADAGVVAVETAVKPWIDAARIAEVSVRVEAPGLTRAGEGIAAELARIRHAGFTDAQLRAARAEVLARFEREAVAWSLVGPDAVIEQLAMAARLQGPGPHTGWVSPAAMLPVAARVLTETTNDALTAHARAVFDPGELACILISPDESETPTEQDARRILAVANAAPPAGDRHIPESLAASTPSTPAEIHQITHDPVADVWTAALSNGVIVRAKRTPGQSESMVRVTVCDGVAREDAATLGRTRDAANAWRYPRTARADAGQLRAWSIDRAVTFRPNIADHMLTLEIDAGVPSPAGVSDALTLAAALLAEPRTDHAYAPRVVIEQPDFGPGIRRLGELFLDPADPRSRKAPPPERVDSAAADAWLATLAKAPLEVAIVGDLPPEEAIRHAANTLGALPARPAPSRARAWSAMPRGEAVERLTDPTASEAVLGIVFADASDLARVRPMMIAAAAIDAELKAACAADAPSGMPRAWVWLGDGIPDRAALIVRIADTPDPDAAMRAIHAAIDRVIDAESDPAVLAGEIDRARRIVERAWSQPAFWADRLSRLAVHGLDTNALADMPAAYASLTPESVREALAAAGAGVHKRVIVTKEAPAE